MMIDGRITQKKVNKAMNSDAKTLRFFGNRYVGLTRYKKYQAGGRDSM